MQKKVDKMGNKTAYKEERQTEKRERDRKIKIESQILACGKGRKTKKLFNFIRLIGKKELVKNADFFAICWPSHLSEKKE